MELSDLCAIEVWLETAGGPQQKWTLMKPSRTHRMRHQYYQATSHEYVWRLQSTGWLTVRQGKHTLQAMFCQLLEATQLISLSLSLLFFHLLFFYLESFMLKRDILLFNLSLLHADMTTNISSANLPYNLTAISANHFHSMPSWVQSYCKGLTKKTPFCWNTSARKALNRSLYKTCLIFCNVSWLGDRSALDVSSFTLNIA